MLHLHVDFPLFLFSIVTLVHLSNSALVLKSKFETACRLLMMPSGYGVSLCPHLVWAPLPSKVIVWVLYLHSFFLSCVGPCTGTENMMQVELELSNSGSQHTQAKT